MENAGHLKEKAITGFFWQFCQRISSQVISFIVSVVLARMLSPDEFGLVAMTSIFLSLASVFATSGLGSSLVQKKEVDQLDCNTVFYSGLVLSLIIYFILFFTAPLIAGMYNKPELIWIVRAQGIGVLFSSIASVQNALVYRKLDYKQFFKVSLVSTIISGFVGVYMAFAGYGYWALIGQSYSASIVGIITMNRIIKWKPSFQFSFTRLKQLYAFGLNLTGANILGQFFSELRGFLIGLRYSPADLAYSNRGSSIPSILNNNISVTIYSVLFPTLSRMQDDKEAIKSSMRRSLKVISFLIAPTMVLLSAVSDKVVLLLYTSKWAMAIPFMQIVCFQYLFNIISDSNLQAINAIGRSDITFKLEFAKKPIYLVILLYTMTISPLAMTVGWALYAVVAGIINAFPNKKLINYSYMEQIKDIYPQIVLSFLMGALVYFVGMYDMNTVVLLILQVFIGLCFYFFVSYILHFDSMMYLIKTINEFRNK